ncbi:MAG TPA: hypothetical protein VG106_06880, partial [Vicinamibacterales bacterium]|nr:hypothetical protein [Vicinamibacterales bacterium]
MVRMLTAAGVSLSLLGFSSQAGKPETALREALTFHASFDEGTEAAAAGDPALYWAASLKERAAATAGLPPSGDVQLAAGAGRVGGALRFTRRKSPAVFYRA